MVGTTGIEPVTPSMSTKCSTAELRAHQHDIQRPKQKGTRKTAPSEAVYAAPDESSREIYLSSQSNTGESRLSVRLDFFFKQSVLVFGEIIEREK